MFQFGQNQHLDPIFENDYCYDRISTFHETVYVQCHEKLGKKCFARGSLSNNGPIVLTTEHNHKANTDLKLIYDFKKDLYLAVISNFDQLRNIYNDISVKHPRASSCVPYINISKTMFNWRRTICPPIPKTLEEYCILVTSDKWKHLLHSSNSQLTVTNVYGDDGSIATVFYDSVFLRNCQSVRIFADATFKICPRLSRGKIYQFFTIMVAFNDTVFPVAWSLMSRKSTSCYTAVIQCFARSAPHLNVTSFMIDFEMGLRKAFKKCFPNAVSHGCYFHYVQALIKKADDLRLLELLKDWEDGQMFFRKLIALALLPAKDIEGAYNWLINYYAAILSPFRAFLKYYLSYWMKIVKPENFSIFNLLDSTNNYSEAYNRFLKNYFGIHSSMWQFTVSLKKLCEVMKIEFSTALMGRSTRRAIRCKNELHAQLITKIWEMYLSGTLDIPHFLLCSAHIIPVFGNRHIIQNAQDIDRYVNIPLSTYVAVDEKNYLEIQYN